MKIRSHGIFSRRNSIIRKSPKVSVLLLVVFAFHSPLNLTAVGAPQAVCPNEEPPVLEQDYFTTYHDNPCDFETPDDFERISEFGPGIKDRKVKKGCLSFVTSKEDNFFCFGRFRYPDGPADAPDENIAFDWPHWGQFRIIVRLKQSEPISVLRTSQRSLHGGRGGLPGRVQETNRQGATVLKGTEWQTIEIPFQLDRGTPIRGLFFGFDGEDNHIEIDDIKVVLLRSPVFYRKRVSLDEEPVFAVLRVGFPDEHYIYVNGRRAHYYHGYINTGVNPVVDITPYLQKGDNVIAVGVPNSMRSGSSERAAGAYCEMVSRGTILTKRGTYVSLDSDTAWKGSFHEQDAWETPEFNDDSWAAVPARNQDIGEPGPQAYSGPLQVQPIPPIFAIQEGMRLSVPVPTGYTVQYVLTDAFTERKQGEGSLSKQADGGAVETHSLTHKPAKPGVWNLSLRLLDETGQETAQRTIEVAVAGPIHQKKVPGNSFTEGMELTLIGEIDCAHEPPKGLRRTSEPEVAKIDEMSDASSLIEDDSTDSEDLGLDFDIGAEAARIEKEAQDEVRGQDLANTLYDFGPEGWDVKPSTVRKSEIGAYRESGDIDWTGFGYVFPVKHLYRPHLIEVEYPDDAERQMNVKVFSSKDPAYAKEPTREWSWFTQQRWHTSAITGGEAFPVSHTFKKLYLIFWPNGVKEANTIQIICRADGLKAAARRIKIYEIDDIPALDLPDTPHRLFGYYNERAVQLCRKFYTGKYNPDFNEHDVARTDYLGNVRDWYITIENFIKYLRFSGQNVYAAGHFQYTGVYFPETEGRGEQRFRRLPIEYFTLMASMFEQNNLYLLLGCEYDNTYVLREKCWPTNWEVHRGADTVFAVSKDGQQSLTGHASTHVFDYQNPRVEEDILAVMDLYVKYGAPHRSVLGICYLPRNISFPCLPEAYIGGDTTRSLSWGWQDNAVAAFEEASGVKIPVPPDDPERFRKRYDYVTRDPELLNRWIDFRCRRVHSQVIRVLDHVQKVRKDWKLYIDQIILPDGTRQDFLEGRISFSEALRRRGFDRSLYTENGIVNLPEVSRDGILGKDVWTTFFGSEAREYWKEADGLYLNRQGGAHSQEVVAAEPYAYWAYTLGIMDCTPSIILFSQSDRSPTTGAEQRFRPFIRLYRSLPEGGFSRITGDTIDNGVVIRRNGTGSPCFYVVNPTKWNVSATLTLDGASAISDLVTGRQISQGPTLSLELRPYENRAFVCSPKNARIVECRTVLSDAGLAEIKKWDEEYTKIADKLEDASHREYVRDIVGKMRQALVTHDFFLCDSLSRDSRLFQILSQQNID